MSLRRWTGQDASGGGIFAKMKKHTRPIWRRYLGMGPVNLNAPLPTRRAPITRPSGCLLGRFRRAGFTLGGHRLLSLYRIPIFIASTLTISYLPPSSW